MADPLVFNQNFQLLMDIANNTEKIPPHLFYMEYYITSCGTMGCMIGHYSLKINKNIDYINHNLMISQRDWSFLFTGCGWRVGKGKWMKIINLTPNDPIKAARRLRKYIYYKLHKREILGSDYSKKEDRDKYQKAREQEGDYGFACKFKKDAVCVAGV